MLSLRSALSVVAAGLVLVGVSACDLLTPKIDKKLAEDLVGKIFSNEGMKADSIECPANQPVKKGHTFECTAKVHGVDVHFKMEVLDDQGMVMASPRDHTLVVADAEPEIKADLQARGHSVKTIDCHGEVWVAVKGATVTCDITDEAGAAYVWSATFTDDEGGHTHEINPK